MAPHVLRIGHAERDAAAADLGEHYVAGRLTLDELHERLGAVFTAKTYGQLTRIMSDLPRLRRPTGPMQAAWAGAYWPSAGFPPSPSERRHATPSDRAARFAAVSLLILAMLIWLFTAMVFARHGFYPRTWRSPVQRPRRAVAAAPYMDALRHDQVTEVAL